MLDRSIRLGCNLVAEFTALRREVRVFAQVLNPTKQELQLPVRSGRRVLGNLSNLVSNQQLTVERRDFVLPCVQRVR